MTDSQGTPRVERAQRDQLEFRVVDLQALVAADHPARLVWAFVERMDLSPWYERIQSRSGRAGRPAIDPKILMALWLYATIDGVGSARRLEALCEEHGAYRWICGGVGVNYHTLADFRSQHAADLDTLLTRSVAVLMEQGLVTLTAVAQDGKRVRASSGAASYRRRPTLERCLDQARAQVEALRAQLESDPAAYSARERAARERAAGERLARVERALERCHRLEDDARQHKNRKDPGAVRVSTTDPEMPVMRMPDGGYRPAINVQYATDVASQIVVGVDAVNTTDAQQLVPMSDQLHRRYHRHPEHMLADAPYASRNAVSTLSRRGITVWAPVRRPTDPQRHHPAQRRYPDDDAFAQFRERMQTDQAKTIYKQRAATAECVNAHVTQRNFTRVTVRGLLKTKAAALWHALAHNLTRAASLGYRWAEATP